MRPCANRVLAAVLGFRARDESTISWPKGNNAGLRRSLRMISPVPDTKGWRCAGFQADLLGLPKLWRLIRPGPTDLAGRRCGCLQIAEWDRQIGRASCRERV